ncbi:olfactory receptor 14J1-like [Ammospiza caudacuta]|uniref:olfactory receptor 14J1-like n=1 Tax=Ammospiza caudacuta TaxID=2857398 RepID=UPI002739D6D8|nr:olfactory receptor 14J1-like [Ammospiza caudacuta]
MRLRYPAGRGSHRPRRCADKSCVCTPRTNHIASLSLSAPDIICASTPRFRTGKAVKQRLARAGEEGEAAAPLELTVKPEPARAEPACGGQSAPPLEPARAGEWAPPAESEEMKICLLTIMSYDRYISICKPLHYGTLLGSRACAHMAAAAWASAFLNALLHTANTFSLPLCRGNALGQFFCGIPQILKLSCSKSYLRDFGLLAVSACLSFGCFVFIFFSYVQIFRVVLRIPSEQGRHKAFSTCLPHLAVVSLFYSTGTFAYLKPPSISSPSLDLALSVLHSVVPPIINADIEIHTGWL